MSFLLSRVYYFAKLAYVAFLDEAHGSDCVDGVAHLVRDARVSHLVKLLVRSALIVQDAV